MGQRPNLFYYSKSYHNYHWVKLYKGYKEHLCIVTTTCESASVSKIKGLVQKYCNVKFHITIKIFTFSGKMARLDSLLNMTQMGCIGTLGVPYIPRQGLASSAQLPPSLSTLLSLICPSFSTIHGPACPADCATFMDSPRPSLH